MQHKLTIPTLLTWARVCAVPFFVSIYYVPDSFLSLGHKNFLGALLFLMAAVTDYLDGYFARKLKQESPFGAFLDPVADKAIVVASLVVLVDLHRTFIVAVIIIIVREIALSALREWMANIGHSQNVAVAYIGKIKTVMQMTAVTFLLLDYRVGFINTNIIGNIFMLLAVIFTIISMLYYLKQVQNCFD